MTPDHTVDARERPCPIPILELAKAFRSVQVGSLVLLLATDAAAAPDARAWCEATGNELVRLDTEGRLVRVLIRKVG